MGVINRTLLYGEGLFETIKLPSTEERLKLHYERLKSSAEFFGIPYPSYEEFIKDCLLPVEEPTYLKFCLLSEGDDYYGGSSKTYQKLIIKKKLNLPKAPLFLKLSPYRRHSEDPLCKHKTTSYLFNVLVKKDALRDGFYDGIVINEREEVCETSSANLLFLKGSKFYTPAVECGRLEGTTLRLLKTRIEIQEERIKVDRLEDFEGVFLLNALIDCMPAQINGINLKVLPEVAEYVVKILKAGGVAELADAGDLKSPGETPREGSSPSTPT
jgi:4-amino-4-deoxychorismate lyase